MSGYLANLVARGAGPPPAAVAPRLGPLFPVGRPQQSDELPSVDPAEGSHADSWRPDLQPSDLSERHPARSDGESVGRDRAAAAPQSPGKNAEPALAPQATETTAAVGAAAPAPVEHAEKTDGQSAAAEPRAAVDTRIEVRVEPSSAAPGPPPAKQGRLSPARPVVAARTGSPLPLPTRPVVEAATRNLPPKIEVQIGRVEIRRPCEPEPFQWPAPAAEPQTSTGFGELAAARRYVDRGWS